jgi:hypothetical protein
MSGRARLRPEPEQQNDTAPNKTEIGQHLGRRGIGVRFLFALPHFGAANGTLDAPIALS